MQNKPQVQLIDSFNVTGMSVRTKNALEFNLDTASIPGLWQQFYEANPDINQPVYGVYSDYQSDVNGEYTVTAGFVADNDDNDVITINAGNYLVFTAQGDMPQVIVDLWQTVWQYFNSEQQHKRLYQTDFECYDNDGNVAIYIGIN